MTDINYIRKYFSENAPKWVAGAYEEGDIPAQYPVGANRLRIAVETIVERLATHQGTLVDLGCGGGELCLYVAGLGMNATGVDIAEGMIEEAKRKAGEFPDAQKSKLHFVCADVLNNSLPDASSDAVSAMGLIEYLPDDEAFFREAYRLLNPGGVLAVSCRNRLFNLASMNEYTLNEIKSGTSVNLLTEMMNAISGEVSIRHLKEFVANLKATLSNLEKALDMDEKFIKKDEPARKGIGAFAQVRRQHTPAELSIAASQQGFVQPKFFGVHPHPLPPRIEKQAPHFYNQFSKTFEVFEKTPLSLVWSSAFIGVFTKQ
jgi:SAM-dependent methyltransferase